MRNILVTGANGQLGNELRLVTRGCTSKDRYFFTDVTDETPESVEMLRKLGGNCIDTTTQILDITEIDSVRRFVREYGITAIINCAAYTNVDAAEEHFDLAESLNSMAVENLAIVMKEVQGLLVHISTDYVFGKESYNTPCRESQVGTPTGVYGLTKLHGEHAIQRVGCDFIIVRTAWLYSEFGKNFVKTILGLTATKTQIKVVFDQVGTPTYAYDLANVILTIVDDRRSCGNNVIFHYSNEGVCSWYDFAKMITEYAGNYRCEIIPCLSDEFPSKVQRPAYSVLDKYKIKSLLGLSIPFWNDSLRRCLSNITDNNS